METAPFQPSLHNGSLAGLHFVLEGGGLDTETENWEGDRKGDVILMLVSARLGLAYSNFLSIIF